VAQRGPSVIQIYVNGNLEHRPTLPLRRITEPAAVFGTRPIVLGPQVQGTLDEVSLYNRALSAAEIAAVYAAGTGGKCKGAVAPTIAIQPAAKSGGGQ